MSILKKLSMKKKRIWRNCYNGSREGGRMGDNYIFDIDLPTKNFCFDSRNPFAKRIYERLLNDTTKDTKD